MEKVELVVVSLETSLGARYVFPDVEKKILQTFSIQTKGSDPKINQGMLQFVNSSTAILSLPFRIVDKIFIDEELWWERPSSSA